MNIDRNIRLELIETRRQMNELYREMAITYKHMRNYAVGPLIIAGLWTPETSRIHEGRYIFNGAAIVLSLAIAIPTERRRRISKREAQEMAQQAIDIATIEPPLPVPNWAKNELGIED